MLISIYMLNSILVLIFVLLHNHAICHVLKICYFTNTPLHFHQPHQENVLNDTRVFNQTAKKIIRNQ